ncbi:MAG: hypothetical protein HXY20_00115 [Acidobacteria bacterium]|nr:hypothetical protein [Acidobacteriota bacterium]
MSNLFSSGVCRASDSSGPKKPDLSLVCSQPGAPIGSHLMGIDPRGRFAVPAVRYVGKVLVVPLDGSRPATYRVGTRPRAIVQPVN